MTTLVDLTDLLAPISEESPTGADLRADESSSSPYYLLKEARNNARAIERNSFPGQEDPEHPEKQHWNTILKLAPEVLTTKSKDLEVAAWFTEALIRDQGFAGLRLGIQLIQGLIELYWDGLYPLADEDGLSSKVAPLVGLNGINNSNGTLIVPINTTALTANGDYSNWSYTQALELAKITDGTVKKKKQDAGAVSLDTIKNAVKVSATDFYIQLDDDLSNIINALDAIDSLLSERCGDEAPSVEQIRKAVVKASETLHVIAKNILTPEVEEELTETDVMNTSDEPTFGETHSTSPSPFLSSGAKGRFEAFKTLEQLSEFFKRTEPHSPIGFALERILRWGDMSLPELLQELVPDPQAKDYFQKLVGIVPPAPPMQPNSTMMPPNQYGGVDPTMENQYNPDPYQQNRGMFDSGSPAQGGYDDSIYR